MKANIHSVTIARHREAGIGLNSQRQTTANHRVLAVGEWLGY